MPRKLSGLEVTLAGGVLALGAFVGVLVISSRPARSPEAIGLSAADSLSVAAQYQRQIAARHESVRTPTWLQNAHVARLQESAIRYQVDGEEPRPPQDSIDSVLGSAHNSYLQKMLDEDDGVVSRWRPGTAIRVWVQPHSTEPGFSADLVSPARRGFTVWNDLDLGVQFTLVEDSTVADVHVIWSAVMPRPDQVGLTFRIMNFDGWIALAHVILSTSRDIYTVQNAVRHEAGHVLGLGHSPIIDDIMASATEGRQYKLTDADVRTATLLYRLPAGPIKR
jgi:hypothetical protein